MIMYQITRRIILEDEEKNEIFFSKREDLHSTLNTLFDTDRILARKSIYEIIQIQMIGE